MVTAAGEAYGVGPAPGRLLPWAAVCTTRRTVERYAREVTALTLASQVRSAGIDFDLIESQFRHLMRVAVSVREGTVSSSTPLKRLRSGSRKNAIYPAFREVGRVIRTVQLLRYLSEYARILPRGSASNHCGR